MAKATRNSAVEMLRIIAMLFIVMSHSTVYGGFPETGSSVAFNDYLLDWMYLGNLGVAIFLLITGYYLCEKEFSEQSILRLWTQVWFYSVLGTAIHVLSGYKLSLSQLAMAVFPAVYVQFWFFTAYLVLVLLSPYINILIRHLNRKQYLACLSIMLILWCVVPTITRRGFYGNEIAQFVMFYMMGAYLRKHPDNVLKIPAVRYSLAAGFGFLLLGASVVLRLANQYTRTFYDRNSVFNVGCALGLFAVAVYMRPWQSKRINAISSCVFGVYLFHDHTLVRRILWEDWVGNHAYYNSPMLAARMVLSVAAVFAAGIMIDKFRQRFVGKPMLRVAEAGYARMKSAAQRILGKN